MMIQSKIGDKIIASKDRRLLCLWICFLLMGNARLNPFQCHTVDWNLPRFYDCLDGAQFR